MARAKFAAIEEDIKTLNGQVAADVQKSASMTDRLAKLLGQEKLTEVQLDMDDQDFDAVAKSQAAINENLAKLIHGLDGITNSFSQDFKGMTESTRGEKLMGLFSKKRAEAMRSDRVRDASIDEALQELIRKSEIIGGILNTQLAVLSQRKIAVSEAHQKANSEFEEKAQEKSELEARLARLTDEHTAALAQSGEATGPALAALETRVSDLANAMNEAISNLQVNATLTQVLSLARQRFGNYAESLAKQIAAQTTMIEKLKLDTEHRSVLYKTISESIKTAEQQALAHQHDETGRAVDDMTDKMMTQIGVSSQNRVMTMLERHKDYEKLMQGRKTARDAANLNFAARFSAINADLENRYLEG